MKLLPSRPFALGLASVLAAGALTGLTSSGAVAAPGPDRRVIVVLSGDAAIAKAGGSLKNADKSKIKQARADVSAAQAGFLGRVRGAGVQATNERKYDLVLNAITMTVPAADVAALSDLPGVAGVYPSSKVRTQTDTSVPLTGAPQMWEQQDPSGGQVTGTGATVAVIDSGVDYTHPDLGGAFGEGHKVVGGYDFVNGDADPMDDNGHGTHVAGIIAAKAAQPGGITGVAPGASITAYKVMDNWGYGSDEAVIAGIEAAIDPSGPHPADVINMSIGAPTDGNDPIALASTAAVRAGVVVVASAGNNGPYSDTMSSPSIADGVISVGASASNIRLPQVWLDGEKLQTYRGALSANPGTAPVTADLVDVGNGSSEEFAAAGDIRGKIVMVNGFVASDLVDVFEWDLAIQHEAQNRGAIALLGGTSGGGGPVVASTDDRIEASATAMGSWCYQDGTCERMSSLVLIGMDSSQYAELGRKLSTGPVKLTLDGNDITDGIATFSSRGPAPGFALKPDLVAPGVDIMSTALAANDTSRRFRLSGTSMAAPHVAGAAALLVQAHPGRTPVEVKASLMGSAKALTSAPTSGGSGRLDIPAAAATTLVASPPSLSFGLADLSHARVSASADVVLHNLGNSGMTVELSARDSVASVTPDKITLAAGGSASVRVSVSKPRANGWTEISGFVIGTAGATSVRVPYLLVSRPLSVNFSQDPSDGNTSAYIYTPAPLAQAPELTLSPENGPPFTVSTAKLNDYYYKATLSVGKDGGYTATAKGVTTTGQTLIGSGGFAVTPVSTRKNRWEAIGPNSSGGDVTVAPSTPGMAVLSQSGKAGLWVTTDNGAAWRILSRMPVTKTSGRGTVIIDAQNSDRWWYAIHDGVTDSGKIMRTDDRGATWRILNMPGDRILSFIADHQTKVLVALTTAGLFVSTDGGDSWTSHATDVPGARFAAISGGDLYLATGTAIFKRPGIITGTPGTTSTIYPGTRGYIVYNMVGDETTVMWQVLQKGTFASRDGATYTEIKPDGVNSFKSSFGGMYASGGDFVLGRLDDKVWVGRGHGTTWTQITRTSRNTGMGDYDVWADGTITITDTAGVYRSARDGSGAHRIGVQGASVYDLAVAGNAVMAATESGVYRTSVPVSNPEWGAAEGEGWVGLSAKQIAVSLVDDQVVWKTRKGAFRPFFLDRSTDAGQTWQEMGSGLGTPLALAVSPANPNRIVASFADSSGAGLVVSNDGGANWKNLYHGMYFDVIVPDPADPKRLWLGNPAGLFRSDDGGVTVTQITNGRVAAIVLDGNRIVLGGDGVQVSMDGGKAFKNAHVGILPTHVHDIVMVGNVMYAASGGYVDIGLTVGARGVLRSTDGGLNWHNVSNGLQDTDVTTLAVSPDGSWLYAGTVVGGVHRLPVK
jgi:subtilisin family serine protease